ncbi:MAG TPA: hypothetical protein VLE69_02270 [Candidatus Saccharimonadales bacterium]|nr:hypothetical protein [Candidatus Saccharimonadales bacterium]
MSKKVSNPDTIFFGEVARLNEGKIRQHSDIERYVRQAVEDMLDIFVPRPNFDNMTIDNSEFWLDVSELKVIAENNTRQWSKDYENEYGVRPTVSAYEEKLDQSYTDLAYDYSYDGYHVAIERNGGMYGDSN